METVSGVVETVSNEEIVSSEETVSNEHTFICPLMVLNLIFISYMC